MTDPFDVIIWSTVPMDTCPFLFDDQELHPDPIVDPFRGLGMPVAVSGIEEERSTIHVRYVCPHCRHIWDMTYDASDGGQGQQFGDRFIRDAERLVAPYDMEGVQFPAGPAEMFERA